VLLPHEAKLKHGFTWAEQDWIGCKFGTSGLD